MGSFTFTWDHPATEVYVTGTFDNWAKTSKLDKKEGTRFEKTVELPSSAEKIYYKFVVDGNWTTDHTAPQEKDEAGNLNNVLKPEQITKPHSTPAGGAAILSGVTPQSTTTGLANKVPVESKDANHVPGEFPETPLNENKELSVNPIPATAGAGNPVKLAPGEKVPDPSSLTSNTINSTVHDDVALAKKNEGSQQTFGVAPLPATAGIGNPVKLAPGEKVPHPSEITTNTINSTVTTDRESYEKGGSAAGVTAAAIAPQADQKAKSPFDLPPVSKNLIPESSLPIGGDSTFEKDPGVFISSAAPASTTAALAAKVPLENNASAPAVPEVVKESQAQAHVGPEATSSREAVTEKGQVEQELLHKVHEQPAAATSGNPSDEAGKGVPAVVQKSISKAHQSPEAASNQEVVAEKAAMENELLHEVKKSEALGEPDHTQGGAAPATAAGVPGVVSDSIKQAHQEPEAAANREAVTEKKAVESELLKEAKPVRSSRPPAPANSPVLTDSPPKTSQDAGVATKAKPADAADVSSGTKEPKKPTVTSGVQKGKTETTSTSSKTTPSKAKADESSSNKKDHRKSGIVGGSSPSTGDSPTATSKENKRKSGFFRKITEKFSHKK